HRGRRVRGSRDRRSYPPRSALRRRHLAANFAGLVILRIDVDVPLTGRELLRLLGGERRLALYRRLDRAAFGAEPDHRRSVLARRRGPVEVHHGRGSRKPAVGEVPGEHARRRIVGQIGRPGALRLHRRHLLRAGESDLEGFRRRLRCHRPGRSRGQACGQDHALANDRHFHVSPPSCLAAERDDAVRTRPRHPRRITAWASSRVAPALASAHMGGATPLLPMTMTGVSTVPSSSFFPFGTKNFCPALMSATVAGANMTTSVLGGTTTFFSPSLYFITSSWPSLLTTELSTLALVIVLFGMRSHA